MLRSRQIEIVPRHHDLPTPTTHMGNELASEVVTRSQSLLAVSANEAGRAVAEYGPSFAFGTIAMGPVMVRRGVESVVPESLANRTRVKALVNRAATESEDFWVIGKIEEQQIAEKRVIRELPFGVKAPFFHARYALAEKMVRFRVIQKSFERD